MIAACCKNRFELFPFLSLISAKQRILLIINSNIDSETKLLLDKIKADFQVYFLNEDDYEYFFELLEKISPDGNCDTIKLLIDYTSMDKKWYGSLINYFSFSEIKCDKLTIYFVENGHKEPIWEKETEKENKELQDNKNYGIFKFKKSVGKDKKEKTIKQKISPLILHENISYKNRPLALIIGMGIQDYITDLKDFFNPTNIYVFIPWSISGDFIKINEEYCFKHNIKEKYYYNINDIELLDNQLRNLCVMLRPYYRVVVVSLGPNNFSLVSFLINSRYPDIEIWGIEDTFFPELNSTENNIQIFKAVMVNEDATDLHEY